MTVVVLMWTEGDPAWGTSQIGLDKVMWPNIYVPANRPNFIETVPIFDFQNLQKLGHPNFLKF